jgi:membrane-bound metal-dependent hydrolase YbcI (DUF457 family)
MDKRGHVLNAAILAIGLGYLLEPAGDEDTFLRIGEVFVPLILGALFPDVDTHFGKHRKTLHNLWVLVVVVAYPLYFGNLQWVWVGVLSHYVLDVLGTTRGIALFYPLWDEEYNVPLGVPVSSDYSDAMMLSITAFELTGAAFIIYRVPQRMFELVVETVGLA